MARRVFLVGFMGCGKSTFGRNLSARLGWGLIDTDREVELRAGAAIPEIFATRGEEWFRQLEREVIKDAASTEDDVVVALGGGAACREGVMEMLAAAGTTIYLKSSPEKLVRRMGEYGRSRRPKIAGMGDAELLAYIEKTLPGREMFYNKANFVVSSDAVSDESIAGIVLRHIENSNFE